MHEPVTVGEFIVNKATHDALPTDLKEILETTIQAAYWINFVPFQEKTPKACGELIASGVKVIKTTDELNNRVLKVYDETTNGYAAKDPRRRSTRAWLFPSRPPRRAPFRPFTSSVPRPASVFGRDGAIPPGAEPQARGGGRLGDCAR